nr:hypothetical protein [uncultured Campylobacter sp.]
MRREREISVRDLRRCGISVRQNRSCEIEFYKILSTTEPNKILNLKFYGLDKTARLLR